MNFHPSQLEFGFTKSRINGQIVVFVNTPVEEVAFTLTEVPNSGLFTVETLGNVYGEDIDWVNGAYTFVVENAFTLLADIHPLTGYPLSA